MADPIKKQFDALKAWSIDLYQELQDRSAHAALKICKNINAQARKLEYRSRGLSGLPDYLPIVKELKQKVSSARAGVQQIATAMEEADRLRRGAKSVKSAYEKKLPPLFAASEKNATSVMEMVGEAESMYEKYFNNLYSFFPKLVDLYKKESFFPRLMTDALNGKGVFRHRALIVGSLLDLSTANLRNADLRKLGDALNGEISFRNADLRGANLYGVRMGGKGSDQWDFTGANLQGADIKNAHLYYTKGLTPEQISSAKNWRLAILD